MYKLCFVLLFYSVFLWRLPCLLGYAAQSSRLTRKVALSLSPTASLSPFLCDILQVKFIFLSPLISRQLPTASISRLLLRSRFGQIFPPYPLYKLYLSVWAVGISTLGLQ